MGEQWTCSLSTRMSYLEFSVGKHQFCWRGLGAIISAMFEQLFQPIRDTLVLMPEAGVKLLNLCFSRWTKMWNPNSFYLSKRFGCWFLPIEFDTPTMPMDPKLPNLESGAFLAFIHNLLAKRKMRRATLALKLVKNDWARKNIYRLFSFFSLGSNNNGTNITMRISTLRLSSYLAFCYRILFVAWCFLFLSEVCIEGF